MSVWSEASTCATGSWPVAVLIAHLAYGAILGAFYSMA